MERVNNWKSTMNNNYNARFQWNWNDTRAFVNADQTASRISWEEHKMGVLFESKYVKNCIPQT